MLLEYAEASFECMEHRFRQLRGLACVKRVLQLRAGEQCGPSVRRCAGRPGQDAPVPNRDSLICADNRHSSGLKGRTAIGRPRPIELGRDPTASERALGKVRTPLLQTFGPGH